MMRVLLGALLGALILLLVVGCRGPEATTITIGDARSVTTVNEYEVSASDWISPAVVLVDRFHEGATAESHLKIRNSSDSTTKYRLTAIPAPHQVNTYKGKPDVAYKAIPLSPVSREVSVQAGSTATIPIKVVLGEGDWPKYWEFRVSVENLGQKGTVTTGMEQRWLMAMR